MAKMAPIVTRGRAAHFRTGLSGRRGQRLTVASDDHSAGLNGSRGPTD